MQTVVAVYLVVEYERRGTILAGAVAALQELRMGCRDARPVAKRLRPSIGDLCQVRICNGPQFAHDFRQRVRKILVVATAKAEPLHDDLAAEEFITSIQLAKRDALLRGQQLGRNRIARFIERGRQAFPRQPFHPLSDGLLEFRAIAHVSYDLLSTARCLPVSCFQSGHRTARQYVKIVVARQGTHAYSRRIPEPIDLWDALCRRTCRMVRGPQELEACAAESHHSAHLRVRSILLCRHDVQPAATWGHDGARAGSDDRRDCARPVRRGARSLDRAGNPGAFLRRWRHQHPGRELLQYGGPWLAGCVFQLPDDRSGLGVLLEAKGGCSGYSRIS